MDLRRSIVPCGSFLVLALGAIPLARAQTSILTIDTTQSNQAFGWSAVDIGDVNGDSVGDLAIGAPGANSNAGLIHVHSGANGDLIFTAPNPGGVPNYGWTTVALGDVNLDGIPDFAATNPNVANGHVRVHSGSTGSIIRDFTGTTSSFGASVDSIGDLDGDGASDLLVGEYFFISMGAERGAVHAISGNTGTVIHTMILPPGQPSNRMGRSVSSIEDVDGDQVPDVLASGDGLPAVGVFSGATGGWLYTVPSSGLFTNYRLDGGRDLDGDGRGDFVVGDSSLPGWGLRVHSGATGAEIRLHSNVCDAITFSWHVTMLGDVDQDGRADYAAHDYSGHRFRVFSGASGDVIWDLKRSDMTFASPTYDRNGDGKDDIVLGIGSASSGGQTFRGQVQIAVDGVEPVVGIPSALGDGTGAPCPCGNTGTPGAGCAHGGGIGATAVAHGSTSLIGKTFHLTTSGIPVPRLCLLFRGTAEVNGGLGQPAGDGLRGAGGAIKRLGFKQSCSDPLEWEPFSQQPSTWSAGQTYLLQVWYRDNGGPCGTNFNMTNAVLIQTTP